jgi:hypothetical protein
MLKLTDRQLQELELFAKLPEGSIFREWLRTRLAGYDQQTRVASGEDIVRCQGRAQAIAALIDDLEKAAPRRERAQASPRPVQYYRDTEEALRA